MTQLENIETIEKRFWASADNLRANSNYASNEYFMPTRGGKTRPLTKEDFSRKSAIYLKPEAQFDFIVELPERYMWGIYGGGIGRSFMRLRDWWGGDKELLIFMFIKFSLNRTRMTLIARIFTDP
jgi:hypothetical protein